jgi:hypothetical protein
VPTREMLHMMMRPQIHVVVTKLLVMYRFVENQQVNGQEYRRAEAVLKIVPEEYLPC